MKFRIRILVIFCVAFILCFSIAQVQSQIYMEVNNPVYSFLEFLEAKGCIKSSILTTYPISYREIYGMLQEAEMTCSKDPSTVFAIKFIKKNLDYEPVLPYFKPLNFFSYSLSYGDSSLLGEKFHNNEAQPLNKGINTFLNFSTFYSGEKFSFFLKPEIGYYGKFSRIWLKEGYADFRIGRLVFLFGKQAQWWGPGKNVSLILSNNMPSLTMFKITNNYPFILGSLGLFKFTFFISRLGKDRTVANPYIWGLRTNFKPCPYFEFGFSRIALLGGSGKKASLKLWFESLFLKQSNATSEPVAGFTEFDLKFNLFNKIQPFQIYGSFEGTKEKSGIPENWSYLAGIYLPQIYKLKSLFFRAEYSKIIKGSYSHDVYLQGYTYKNYFIGNFAGEDSEALWIEAGHRWFNKSIISQTGFVSVKYRQTGEKEKEYYLKVSKIFNYKALISGEIKYFNISDYAGTGKDRDIFFCGINFSYKW